MIVKKFDPSPELQSYIKCYYLSESNYTETVEDIFFADGCVEVVFHVGLDFYRGDEKECAAKIIGQITQPLTMRAKGKGKSFGIWFLPHTFSLFSGISVSHLNDKAISLDNIFSSNFIDLVQNCIYENDIKKLLEEMNSFLFKKLKQQSNHFKENVAEYAIQYILCKKEESTLDKLVKDCNISNRYLQKIFLEKIGYSPKFFIRVVRFQQALHHLSTSKTCSLTALTYQLGYFDQAHFIREFKEFTGFVPSQFRPDKHPINQHFLSL